MAPACEWRDGDQVIETIFLDGGIKYEQCCSLEEWRDLLIECHSPPVYRGTKKTFVCNLCEGPLSDKVYQKQHLNKHRLSVHECKLLYPAAPVKKCIEKLNPNGNRLEGDALKAFASKVMRMKGDVEAEMREGPESYVSSQRAQVHPRERNESPGLPDHSVAEQQRVDVAEATTSAVKEKSDFDPESSIPKERPLKGGQKRKQAPVSFLEEAEDGDALETLEELQRWRRAMKGESSGQHENEKAEALEEGLPDTESDTADLGSLDRVTDAGECGEVLHKRGSRESASHSKKSKKGKRIQSREDKVEATRTPTSEWTARPKLDPWLEIQRAAHLIGTGAPVTYQKRRGHFEKEDPYALPTSFEDDLEAERKKAEDSYRASAEMEIVATNSVPKPANRFPPTGLSHLIATGKLWKGHGSALGEKEMVSKLESFVNSNEKEDRLEMARGYFIRRMEEANAGEDELRDEMKKVSDAIRYLMNHVSASDETVVTVADKAREATLVLENKRAWDAYEIGEEEAIESSRTRRDLWTQEKMRQWVEIRDAGLESARWSWNEFYHIAALNPLVSQRIPGLPWNHGLEESARVRSSLGVETERVPVPPEAMLLRLQAVVAKQPHSYASPLHGFLNPDTTRPFKSSRASYFAREVLVQFGEYIFAGGACKTIISAQNVDVALANLRQGGQSTEVLRTWFTVVQARAFEDFAYKYPDVFDNIWTMVDPPAVPTESLHKFSDALKRREDLDMMYIPLPFYETNDIEAKTCSTSHVLNHIREVGERRWELEEEIFNS